MRTPIDLNNTIVFVDIDDVWSKRPRFSAALTDAERTIFLSLRVEKRKKDWLAGRVAAKRAVQRELGFPFSNIGILAQSDGPRSGAPKVLLGGQACSLHISISHSGALAAATVMRVPVGLDIEGLLPNDEHLESLALTKAEQAQLHGLSKAAASEALTALWCEKEATAKWLGHGLRAPFSALSPPEGTELQTGWLTYKGASMCWARLFGPRSIGREQ